MRYTQTMLRAIGKIFGKKKKVAKHEHKYVEQEHVERHGTNEWTEKYEDDITWNNFDDDGDIQANDYEEEPQE